VMQSPIIGKKARKWLVLIEASDCAGGTRVRDIPERHLCRLRREGLVSFNSTSAGFHERVQITDAGRDFLGVPS